MIGRDEVRHKLKQKAALIMIIVCVPKAILSDDPEFIKKGQHILFHTGSPLNRSKKLGVSVAMRVVGQTVQFYTVDIYLYPCPEENSGL
jgi:hypothetical protein